VKTLVIGIGNLLRSDDGVGLHIIEALRKESVNDNVDLCEALSGLDIMDSVKGYDRIIMVDAIQRGGIPGQVYQLTIENIKDSQTVHSFSTHLNMDFLKILELGKRLFPGKITEDIIIIGVEAEDITTISDKCTAQVDKAIPEVIELIKRLI
jgi:hydrogenase maturation protease